MTIEIPVIITAMKTINEKANHLRAHLLEWVLVKGPELFIAIYGK
ncbi:MAG TPA: hypothetical protein VHB54_13310 [Mucilaginibacter sp.]|nr:hypothetical protein [Mucilaginibacter sp.]